MRLYLSCCLTGLSFLVVPSSAIAFPILQQAYVKASNTGSPDFFGTAVAISGNTVVIGAPNEASAATGVGGNQADNSAFLSGAAYVFVRDASGVWTQQTYLKASNTASSDNFGTSVAISGDTIVVGAYGEASAATTVNGDQTDNSAPSAGAAYVFVRSGTTWSQQAYLKASNSGPADRFGDAVAISGDTIIVGAQNEDSNATGINAPVTGGSGTQADNSLMDSGAAYVFVRSGATWTQQAYLKASNTGMNDLFGISVTVTGNTAVVGAQGEASNATGIGGNQSDNSKANSGAAYVFVRSGTIWTQQAYIKESNTDTGVLFGSAVSIAGDTLVVGAPGEGSNATGINGNQTNNGFLNAGAAYVFIRSGTLWSQQAYLKASNTGSNDNFGQSVSISGEMIAVGAFNEGSNATGVNGDQANNLASDSGAAYLYSRSGTSWTQQAYLKASNTNTNDRFGLFVGIADGTIVSGAFEEASIANGVGGNQADNSAPGAGAAYIFIVDADGDGVADPLDGCPLDPAKSAPGQCGCGVADTDSDGDGTADCVDQCPNDPAKTAPGACGCGVADTDANGNGVADCNESPTSAQITNPSPCGVCGPTTPTIMLSLIGLYTWSRTRTRRIRVLR